MVKQANPINLGLSATILVLAILACDLPIGVATQAGNLSATETMRALATRVAGTLIPEADSGGEADSEGDTGELDETESQQNVATLTPTTTPTLGAPMVSVSVDTNCRFGPGDVYEYLGALLVGEEAAIVGKLADESFWYIENPDPPPPYCWIWGAYAQVVGDTSEVPVLTPPPTPTNTPVPFDFEPAFVDVVNCAPWNLITRITNTGAITIESASIEVVNHDDPTMSVEQSRDIFTTVVGCGGGLIDNISPGNDGMHYVFIIWLHWAGVETLDIHVRACSEDGLGGTCVEKSITIDNPVDL